ncbi:unnamed protein product, partial [Cyprideis torosa]
LISRQLFALSRVEKPWLSQTLIRWYAKQFKVDVSQALETDLTRYPSLNAFFTRALKPEARPVDPTENAFVSPADGVLSETGPIDKKSLIQAKGSHYNLDELLGGHTELAAPFIDGDFATVYLSPRDYHRLHMPCDATLTEMIYVPGRLFSVSLMTTRHIPRIFTRNERVVCLFDTPHGRLGLVLVGAINVAAIETVWAGLITPPQKKTVTLTRYDEPTAFKCGAEMGRFNMGSTIVVLTEKDAVFWADTARPGTSVNMGQKLGTAACGDS